MVGGRNQKFLNVTCKCPALWNEVKAQRAPREREKEYFPPVDTQRSKGTRMVARKSACTSSRLAAMLGLTAWLLPRSAQDRAQCLTQPAHSLTQCVSHSICHGIFAPRSKKFPWTRFQPSFVVFHSSLKYRWGPGSMPGASLGVADSLNQGRQGPALTEPTS